MGNDRHPGRDPLLGDFRMPARMLPDLKEGRLQTFVGKRLDDRHGVLWPGTVVKGQHDLLVAEKVVLLEVLEAKPGAAGGVDFDDARKAHSTGLVAGWDAVRRRSGSGRLDR